MSLRLHFLLALLALLPACVLTAFQQKVTAEMEPSAELRAQIISVADAVAKKNRLRPDPADQGPNERVYRRSRHHSYRLRFVDTPDGQVRIEYEHNARGADPARTRTQPERDFQRILEAQFSNRLRNITGPTERPPEGKTLPPSPPSP